VRKGQIKQISDRREMPVRQARRRGGRVSIVEGMTTLMASKNKQPSAPNKPCGIIL